MTIEQYIEKINTRYKTGISREHSYRGELQNLLEALCDDTLVTNEPARVECGAPDYILTKKNIPVGYIEAKDIGANLTDKAYKEQFDRYKASLSNLIFTDYLDFHLYREGEFVISVSIGKIENGKLIPNPGKYKEFEQIIKDFATQVSQTIRSAEKLSKMMAGKARMLAAVIENAVTADEEEAHNKVHDDANNSLREQLAAFKQFLIHEITAKEFADIYAQTIAYGMFAARLHDSSLDSFTRKEAAELIPKSNPFLRRLFQYVAGYDLDKRIEWIIDALADIFRATDVAAILKNFGKSTQQQDPIIHFYETFLGEYDPKLRKARGVWYTPEPVVNFMVRAVDDILKTEFGLKDGLADTSKTKVKIKTVNKATADTRSKLKETETEQEVHKVQILDPATGTGTFLAEIIKHIHKKFAGQQGIWSKYVDEHLIPRLNGFEILMASYAMAHLKLDLLLQETGYKAQKEQRFKVFLTNSLEEHHPDTGTLFANMLSDEANAANKVKRDTPVMVVIGNPPYSVSSNNKGEWIESLVADYKKDLNEKNINPLSDDYIKFIRYGQYFIEKNGEGILAFISNNSFVDGLIHRQMRKSLLECFDKIYVLDLHGNSKKKETALDGTPDQNVFDIMQGVSINLFVKNGGKSNNKLGEVKQFDLYGVRGKKYNTLLSESVGSIKWVELPLDSPTYYFTSKDFKYKESYLAGFSISELFILFSNGITTEKDEVALSINEKEHERLIQDLKSLETDAFLRKYPFAVDGSEWKLLNAKNDIERNKTYKIQVLYRPFDFRHSYYTGKTKGIYARPRFEVMRNFLGNQNLGLIIPKQTKESIGTIVTRNIAGHKSFSAYDKSTVFPLYLYPENNAQQTIDGEATRTPNLNKEIVAAIASKLGLAFTAEPLNDGKSFSPIDLLDYIYAVLHSPTYREKYKEFLKIDFPRVPYPKDVQTFQSLKVLGKQLREIHLLESPVVEQYITQYPIDGSNVVDKIRFEENYEQVNGNSITQLDPVYKMGRVYINDEQYFQMVTETAFNFYIGGYQPAQKWLKDRKGRELNFEDILHYQKIIVALFETDRLMKEIDKIEIE